MNRYINAYSKNHGITNHILMAYSQSELVLPVVIRPIRIEEHFTNLYNVIKSEAGPSKIEDIEGLDSAPLLKLGEETKGPVRIALNDLEPTVSNFYKVMSEIILLAQMYSSDSGFLLSERYRSSYSGTWMLPSGYTKMPPSYINMYIEEQSFHSNVYKDWGGFVIKDTPAVLYDWLEINYPHTICKAEPTWERLTVPNTEAVELFNMIKSMPKPPKAPEKDPWEATEDGHIPW